MMTKQIDKASTVEYNTSRKMYEQFLNYTLIRELQLHYMKARHTEDLADSIDDALKEIKRLRSISQEDIEFMEDTLYRHKCPGCIEQFADSEQLEQHIWEVHLSSDKVMRFEKQKAEHDMK